MRHIYGRLSLSLFLSFSASSRNNMTFSEARIRLKSRTVILQIVWKPRRQLCVNKHNSVRQQEKTSASSIKTFSPVFGWINFSIYLSAVWTPRQLNDRNKYKNTTLWIMNNASLHVCISIIQTNHYIYSIIFIMNYSPAWSAHWQYNRRPWVWIQVAGWRFWWFKKGKKTDVFLTSNWAPGKQMGVVLVSDSNTLTNTTCIYRYTHAKG